MPGHGMWSYWELDKEFFEINYFPQQIENKTFKWGMYSNWSCGFEYNLHEISNYHLSIVFFQVNFTINKNFCLILWHGLPCEKKCTKIQVYTQHLTSMVTCDETGISLWHDLSHHIQVWDSYKQSKFLIKNLRLNLLQLTVLSSSLTKSSLIFHIPYSKTTLKKTKTCTIPTVMFLPPFHFLSQSHV